MQRLGMGELDKATAEEAAATHPGGLRHGAPGVVERRFRPALREAKQRSRRQVAGLLERHDHALRSLERALGGVELAHASEHLSEHPATPAFLERVVVRMAMLAQ